LLIKSKNGLVVCELAKKITSQPVKYPIPQPPGSGVLPIIVLSNKKQKQEFIVQNRHVHLG